MLIGIELTMDKFGYLDISFMLSFLSLFETVSSF